MRILVTGGSGFLGRAVVDRLRGRGDLFLLSRSGRESADGIVVLGDLDDPASTAEALRKADPHAVVHLAGRTPPAPAADLYRANTLGTLHLLDALRTLKRPVRLVAAGSAAELGPVAVEHLPVGEDHRAHPAEPYGLSKLLATTAVLAASPPIEPIVARIFNPIGPGTPTSQAFGRFAAALATTGPDPLILRVGDLSPKRDFIDVRDAAAAIVALLERGRPRTLYHVGTGRSRSIQEGLDLLIRLAAREVRVEIDADLAARPGPFDSRADVRRLIADVGVEPAIAWETSLGDLWSSVRSTRGE